MIFFRIALSELNVEISKFGAKLEKLFPSEVSKPDLQQILSLPLEDLIERKKIGKKTSKEIFSKRIEILEMSKKIQDDERVLDVLAKGCLARSAVHFLTSFFKVGLHSGGSFIYSCYISHK